MGGGGRVALALRAGQREGGARGGKLVSLLRGPALPDRWTGPGGTRTDEPREKAPSSSSAKSPQDPSPGGAPSQTRPRGASRVSRSGFYRKTLRPNFVSGESRVARRRLRPRRATRSKIVTWLILPVVICLSQRLSHACLSI